MSRDHCRRLENDKRVAHTGRQVIEPGEHKPIDVAETRRFGDLRRSALS